MFWIRQVDLNETELHVSGSIVVAIAVVSRTDNIHTRICHARIQIVNVLQLRTSENNTVHKGNANWKKTAHTHKNTTYRMVVSR